MPSLSLFPWRAVLLAGFVWAGAAAPSPAAEDPATKQRLVTGKRLVDAYCVSCHVVDGTRGTDMAPPLPIIAKRSTGDTAWLRAWLSDPHPPMPNPNLARQEIEDVVLYLESLAE